MNYRSEIFELPCGYLTEQGALFKHVSVREMTGKEEDLLTDKKKMVSGSAINELIGSCCKLIYDPELGEKSQQQASMEITPEVAKNMTQGDRLSALLRIRQVSYGNTYKISVKCEGCEKKATFSIPLDQLKVLPMKDPATRTYDVKLPRSGHTLTFKISTGVEESKMQRMREQNPGSEATINLAARLVSVNGETVNPFPYLQSLNVVDRQFYRDQVEAVEGGVDTKLNLICAGCEQELNLDLPIQESFFLPTPD